MINALTTFINISISPLIDKYEITASQKQFLGLEDLARVASNLYTTLGFIDGYTQQLDNVDISLKNNIDHKSVISGNELVIILNKTV